MRRFTLIAKAVPAPGPVDVLAVRAKVGSAERASYYDGEMASLLSTPTVGESPRGGLPFDAAIIFPACHIPLRTHSLTTLTGGVDE